MKFQKNRPVPFKGKPTFKMDKFRKMRVGIDCVVLETAVDFHRFMSYRWKLSKEGLKFIQEIHGTTIRVWRTE